MSGDGGTGLRNGRGEFATRRSQIDLYYIVHDVAIVAAKSHLDPLKDPATVSQSGWDSARSFLVSKWGKISPAREICRQLRDHAGRSYPWEQLLADVFDESTDFTQHHAQRLSRPDRTITDEHVYWALNHVAHRRGLASLRPHEYEAERKELLEKAARNMLARRTLEKTLPTANQVTTHCRGDWDRALEIAQLQPRAAAPTAKKEALSVPRAMSLFYMRHGYLPSQRQLRSFVTGEGLACQAWQYEPWETWCAEATALITAEGQPAPNPYPGKIPPPGWQPRELDLSGLPQRHVHGYTRLQALDAVYDFKLTLRAGEAPTDKRYKAFARGKPGVPSLNVINRHDGLAALLTELAHPDWRERALRDQEDRDREVAEKAAAAECKPHVRKPHPRNPEKKMTFLTMLRDQGPLPNRDFVGALGCSRMRVWELFAELSERGLVETTETDRRSPNQRYKLTSAGHEALQDETALRELLADPAAEPTQTDEHRAPSADTVEDDLEEAA